MVWARVGSIDRQYVVADLFQVECYQYQNAGHLLVCTRIFKNTHTRLCPLAERCSSDAN